MPDDEHIARRGRLREARRLKAATGVFEWIRPHIPEASDGILTSAGICEGFAGAGVGPRVLLFAGFAGLVAGTMAMGTVEYSKLRVEHERKAAQLAAERAQLDAAPGAELDELAQLYVSRGLSPGLAGRVAAELTAHDALAAHAEAEYGITPVSRPPLREALAMCTAFAAGALLPWLTIMLVPGPFRVPVTFAVVLAALALTGWAAALTSHVRPIIPMVRTALIGGISMLVTYFSGHLFYP